MLYTIQNDDLKVIINAYGAELWPIQTADGTQYLWQGDAAYWEHRALSLFPVVGACYHGAYRYRERLYQIDMHGFVKDSLLEPVHRTKDSVCFALEDTADTYRMYPFHFRYEITFSLLQKKLLISIRVQNPGTSALHFAVGGHPGFRVPLERGLPYESYYLEFSKPCSARTVSCTCRPCHIDGGFVPYPIADGKLRLSHPLFAQQMLILKDTSGAVTLKSDRGSRQITVEYPDMRYLGLWKCIGTDAPYICIEPWSALPDRLGVCEAIEKKADMTHLEPGGRYQNEWSIAEQ